MDAIHPPADTIEDTRTGERTALNEAARAGVCGTCGGNEVCAVCLEPFDRHPRETWVEHVKEHGTQDCPHCHGSGKAAEI